MGLLMNYPHGVPDKFEYCLMQEGEKPTWHSVELEGSWFPDAFVGTMGSLMRYKQGEIDVLPTSVEDVIKTMAVVEAAYASSDSGGVPIASPPGPLSLGEGEPDDHSAAASATASAAATAKQ
jgi:hypothetical protein